MWSPQRADKICWVSVEFSWDKKQTQHLRASQICLACLPGFLSKQVPGQASSWDEPRFMGYPETLLCFKKEKKKGTKDLSPLLSFQTSILKYLTGHIASFMNLIILVLTICLHATTSLETGCLPFQNDIFPSGCLNSLLFCWMNVLQQLLILAFLITWISVEK